MRPDRREPLPQPRKGSAASGAWRRWTVGTRRTLRRISHLRASPHEIALGCAVGAFAAITPLLGVQTLIAIVLAGALRASIPAAVLGTFFGNPLSWPFIWASTYAMGLQIVGFDGRLEPSALKDNALLLWGALLERSPHLLDTTAALLWPLLLPMLAGSLPIGLLTAAVVYYISKNAVRAWRPRRMTGTSATAD